MLVEHVRDQNAHIMITLTVDDSTSAVRVSGLVSEKPL